MESLVVDSRISKMTACGVKVGNIKACTHYFYQIFIFSTNDRPLKTMENVFYFVQKALFILEIFKFLYFCPSIFFSLLVIALEDD